MRRLLFWSVAVSLLLCAGLAVSLLIAAVGPDWEKRNGVDKRAWGQIVTATAKGSAGGWGEIGATYHRCIVREFGDPVDAPPPLSAQEVDELFDAQFIGHFNFADAAFEAMARARGERETTVRKSGRPVYAMKFYESSITKGTGAAEPARWTPMYDGLAKCTLLWGAVIGAVIGSAWCILWLVPKVWRVSRGRCVLCGYSLKGLKRGADCPECGCRSPGARR